jgi:hypothetical protein
MIGLKPGLAGKAPGGLEMMLKQLGLGEVIEAAQKLASSGTVEAILKFSRDVEALNASISQIAASQDRIEALLARALATGGPGSVEAGPDPADCGLDGAGAGEAAPGQLGADRGPGAPGAPGRAPHRRRGADVRPAGEAGELAGDA